MTSKKSLSNELALYPTPLAVVGTVVDGRVNWVTIAFTGIYGMKEISLCIDRSHFTTGALKIGETISVNLIDEELIPATDYVGVHSGKDLDKSQVFDYYFESSETAPIISEAPISMECEIIDIVREDNYILRVKNTLAREDVLGEDGKIDLAKAKPVLFSYLNNEYLLVGEKVGNCWADFKKYRP